MLAKEKVTQRHDNEEIADYKRDVRLSINRIRDAGREEEKTNKHVRGKPDQNNHVFK